MNDLNKIIKMVIVMLALVFCVTRVYASWTAPTQTPPGDNPPPPINDGLTTQYKDGALGIGGVIHGYSSAVFDGSVGVGTVPTEKLEVNGNVKATAFFYSSDRSLKNNILPITDALNRLTKLQGVTFNWNKDGRGDMGVIAQDVEKVFPEVVSTNKESGLKSVEYANLVAPLIESVKELKQITDMQEEEILNLKKEIEILKSDNH